MSRQKLWLGFMCGAYMLLLTLLAQEASGGETSLTLVREGVPQASIVVAKTPTKAAQLGADELRYHVAKITGAELPIISDDQAVKGTRILVGESSATRALGLTSASFGEQEYLIRFLPDTLILMGRDKPDTGKINYLGANGWSGLTGLFDEQGTAYAVYDFLERYCGVRWYAPTEAGMVYPRKSTLVVRGGKIRRAPAFAYREALPSANYQKFTLLGMVKGLWFDVSLRDRDWNLFWHRLRAGGRPFKVNHSFYGYYSRFWKQDKNKPEVFVSRRPEFFAQGYPKNAKPPQMCYTNPDFIAQVVEDARNFFNGKGLPYGAVARGNYFALEPMDNPYQSKGQACSALLKPQKEGVPYAEERRASDLVFGFVNKVAREIKKSHPDKYLSVLAYGDHFFPPQHEELESNVAVMMSLRVRNWWVPYIKQHDMTIYKAWIAEAEKSNRQLYVWLYYCFPEEIARGKHFAVFPGFFAHTLAKQIKMFAEDGVQGVFLNGLGEQVDTYITFKLLDDPTLDVDKLLNEFFTRYYGDAGKPLEQLYREIESVYSDPRSYPESVRNTTVLRTHQTEELAWKYLGTPERMDRWKSLVAEAVKLANTDLEKKRVEKFVSAVWQPMFEGFTSYQRMVVNVPKREFLKKQKLPQLRVPRIPDAGGDFERVDWTKGSRIEHKAPGVSGSWHLADGFPTNRQIDGRAVHDGKFFYVRLSEQGIEPSGLDRSGDIEKDDTWEIYFAKDRGREKPFRRFWVNADGKFMSKAYFEKDAQKKTAWESAAKVKSEVTKDSWTVYLAFPLDKILEGGMLPQKKYYVNFVRAGNRKQAADEDPIVTWSPTFFENKRFPRDVHMMPWAVWDTRDLGEMILE